MYPPLPPEDGMLGNLHDGIRLFGSAEPSFFRFPRHFPHLFLKKYGFFYIFLYFWVIGWGTKTVMFRIIIPKNTMKTIDTVRKACATHRSCQMFHLLIISQKTKTVKIFGVKKSQRYAFYNNRKED